jgi:hypothetical protein
LEDEALAILGINIVFPPDPTAGGPRFVMPAADGEIGGLPNHPYRRDRRSHETRLYKKRVLDLRSPNRVGFVVAAA